MSYGDGNPNANIMLIGEAWGEEEERMGRPFVGRSGEELNRMLHEAGIMRSETYCTNLINRRPPYNDLSKWVALKKKDITSAHVILRDKHVLPLIAEGHNSLMKEIGLVRPNIIVALGNYALWALTGRWGIMKWRGSQLLSDDGEGFKIIPTIHPAAILREYSYRPVVLHDLRRAGKERNSPHYTNLPEWDFIIRPSYHKVVSVLEMLTHRAEAEGHIWVEFDLETTPHHISCAGISWSRTEAMCVPFLTNGQNYWSGEEEGAVVYALYRFLTNPKVWVRGQNLLYDCQHTYRWWHFIPNVKQDTMLSHHSMFCGMKKSLDFQASLYCDHYEFWKEMHRDLSNKAGA